MSRAPAVEQGKATTTRTRKPRGTAVAVVTQFTRKQKTRYQLLPEPVLEDFEHLLESIRSRGILDPVEVDEEGNILSGFTRQRIAEQLGIECPTILRDGLNSDAAKKIYALERDIARRHLTADQKVVLARDIEPVFAERSLQRQIESGRAQAPSATNDAKGGGRTVDQLAKAVGLGSGRSYERKRRDLEKVEQGAPGFVDLIRNGDMTLKDAVNRARRMGNQSEDPSQAPAHNAIDLHADRQIQVRLDKISELVAELQTNSVSPHDAAMAIRDYPKKLTADQREANRERFKETVGWLTLVADLTYTLGTPT